REYGTARTTAPRAAKCALTPGARVSFSRDAVGRWKIAWSRAIAPPSAVLLGCGNDGERLSAAEAPPPSAAEPLLPEPPPRWERARTSAASTAAAAA